jgi:multiple sugar transport system substrate-binding protein
MTDFDIYGGQAEKPIDYLAFKYDGKTVGYSNANEVLALWFNKSMFDSAGIDYPPATLDTAWSWDEFLDVAKQLTIDINGNNAHSADFDKNNIVQYGAYINAFYWQLEVWALSNGGRFFSADGKQIVFDDAAVEAMQMVYDLHLVHNVAPFNDGTQDNGFGSSVGAGNVAMCTEGQWAVGFRGGATEVDYGVGVLPYMKNKVTISTAGLVGMFSQTKYPEETAEFVRWYSDEEFNFGIIEAGWWMPAKWSWYTDEAKLQRWVFDNELRQALDADRYMTAIVEVAMDTNVTKPTGWYYTPNYFEIEQVMMPALAEAANGSRTAKEVVDSVRAAAQAALDQ